MILIKILFHLLEAMLQTGTSERKLVALSVIQKKSLTGSSGFDIRTAILQTFH